MKKYTKGHKGGRNIMNIGNQILNIRKENQLTQEEFGKLFNEGGNRYVYLCQLYGSGLCQRH